MPLANSPDIAKPLKATPMVSAVMAPEPEFTLATTRKKIASIPKPPQLKSFRTVVVVMSPDLRR